MGHQKSPRLSNMIASNNILGRPPCKSHGTTGLLEEAPHYQEVAIAGRGSFGVCLRARSLLAAEPKDVAIKLLPRGSFLKGYKTYIKREITHQSSIQHPQVVSISEVFLTSQYLGIVMDYAGGGDLHSYLQSLPNNRLSECEARWLFQQLIIGLDFCHQRGIALRDLKLENILLDTANPAVPPLVKLCDFGFCKNEFADSHAKTSLGSALYMPPEVILCSSGSIYDAKKADIWAAGIILYAMLCGRYPFDIKNPRFMRAMCAGQFEFPEDVALGDDIKDLISLMLIPCPVDRASIESIMQHPWFVKDLPCGALSMNEQLMNQQPELSHETVSRISSLVDMACEIGHEGDSFVSLKI